jgi:hypothetical protein
MADFQADFRHTPRDGVSSFVLGGGGFCGHKHARADQ